MYINKSKELEDKEQYKCVADEDVEDSETEWTISLLTSRFSG